MDGKYQRSRPLLFNIYINYLFFLTECTDVCNFAADTTFFACDSNLKQLMQRLGHDTKLAIEWFEENYMKLKEDKCHLLVAGYSMKFYGLTLEKLEFGRVRMKNSLD